MIITIVLGGVMCLLASMVVSDLVRFKDYPVVVSNCIPILLLIAALGILSALINNS